MATKGRGIRALKKQYEGNVNAFDSIAKKATEEYANSLPEYSQEQVAADFDITTSCLRNLMDYAIIESIVTREIADGVLRKSVLNQQKKHPEAGGTSIKHHRDLIKQREDKKAGELDIFTIDMAVSEYLYGTGDINVVINTYKLESKKIFNLVLKRAIAENVCSDEDVDKLIEKSLSKSITLDKIKLFRELIEKREEFKSKIPNI